MASRPYRFKKYQLSDNTHATFMSGVSMSRWSISLNRWVSGNGRRTGVSACAPRSYALRTNPLKKKLIHPMITVCGTIITRLFLPLSLIHI